MFKECKRSEDHWKPSNLLFIAKHKGFKGSFELIPVKTNLRFIVSHVFIPTSTRMWCAPVIAFRCACQLIPTVAEDSCEFRHAEEWIFMTRITNSRYQKIIMCFYPRYRRNIITNLAMNPWISWSGLNPHKPSKSVRAMAISGLWFGSLYTWRH